jgi:hypothetical protein
MDFDSFVGFQAVGGHKQFRSLSVVITGQPGPHSLCAEECSTTHKRELEISSWQMHD